MLRVKINGAFSPLTPVLSERGGMQETVMCDRARYVVHLFRSTGWVRPAPIATEGTFSCQNHEAFEV